MESERLSDPQGKTQIQHPSLKVKGKDVVCFTGMTGTATPQKSHLVESNLFLSLLCYEVEIVTIKQKKL